MPAVVVSQPPRSMGVSPVRMTARSRSPDPQRIASSTAHGVGATNLASPKRQRGRPGAWASDPFERPVGVVQDLWHTSITDTNRREGRSAVVPHGLSPRAGHANGATGGTKTGCRPCKPDAPALFADSPSPALRVGCAIGCWHGREPKRRRLPTGGAPRLRRLGVGGGKNEQPSMQAPRVVLYCKQLGM